MFSGLRAGDVNKVTRQQVDTELAAHGHGVVEIRRDDGTGTWSVVGDSPYNRRITALATECRISGPAAGDARLARMATPPAPGSSAPWPIVPAARRRGHGPDRRGELHQYFAGDPEKTPDARDLGRYGFKPVSRYAWSRYYDRFDVEKDPREPNKFGWIVRVGIRTIPGRCR